jgi:site-specific DNA-methyltransferase (adenine-specific)
MKGLKQLQDNSAQIIIADPPYNIKKNFGNNFDKLSLADYLNWCDQ